MADLILTTFDWVPEMPRGYVRDLRVRWALEEAGLPYRVESVPFRRSESRAFRAPALRPGAVVDRWRHLDLRERRDPAASRRAQRRADACRSARSQRGDGMAVRGAQFGRDGEPALVHVEVLRRRRRYAGMEAFGRVPQGPGSSTWSRCWQDANGWRDPSPSPTSSWRTCCASSIGSTGWRNIPPAVTTSRAPRPARLS